MCVYGVSRSGSNGSRTEDGRYSGFSRQSNGNGLPPGSPCHGLASEPRRWSRSAAHGEVPLDTRVTFSCTSSYIIP